MISSWNNFSSNINEVKKLGELYDHMVKSLKLPGEDLVDLLRVQLVNTISAFDRLIHDFVRIGIVNQMKGIDSMTLKTGSRFQFDAKSFVELSNLSDSPKDQIKKHSILETRTELVLKSMSFQNPEKIKDALSYIWDEPHKWDKLSKGMFMKEDELTTKLSLYVDRRNQIVHEADFDRLSHSRKTITRQTIDECIDLYYNLGRQVAILACGLTSISP